MRELLEGIPHLERFKHVDELEEASRELAKTHTDTVEWRTIGQSSEGRPVTALIIGEGDQSVFLYGFTHPNEPIGSLTVEYLASRLASSAELRKRLPYRFILAKAIDVDGAKLNEGWFRGPFDLLTYAENYYRPPPNEQAEWTFPIDYKTLHWSTPIPETQAIKNVVDEFKPAFTCILHNADFCGIYYYLSHPLPAAYAELKRIPSFEGLPLHRGEPPDELYLKTLDEGIYHDYGTSDEYEFLSSTHNADPATRINYGTDCYEYIRNLYDGFCFTCELPHFYDERIQDTTPTQEKRRDLLLGSLEIEADTQRFIQRIVDESRKLVNMNSRISAQFNTSLTVGPTFSKPHMHFQRTVPLTDQRRSRRNSTLLSLRDSRKCRYLEWWGGFSMRPRLKQDTGNYDRCGTRCIHAYSSSTTSLGKNPTRTQFPRTLVRIQLQSALTCLRHFDSQE